MPTVTLTRQTSASTKPGAYLMCLTISNPNNISPYLFVKQRIVKPDGSIDGVFAAVASPTQLEDLGELAPNPEETYYLDSTVTLINNDPAYLDEIFQEILADLQLTLSQVNDLSIITGNEIYTVSNI